MKIIQNGNLVSIYPYAPCVVPEGSSNGDLVLDLCTRSIDVLATHVSGDYVTLREFLLNSGFSENSEGILKKTPDYNLLVLFSKNNELILTNSREEKFILDLAINRLAPNAKLKMLLLKVYLEVGCLVAKAHIPEYTVTKPNLLFDRSERESSDNLRVVTEVKPKHTQIFGLPDMFTIIDIFYADTLIPDKLEVDSSLSYGSITSISQDLYKSYCSMSPGALYGPNTLLGVHLTCNGWSSCSSKDPELQAKLDGIFKFITAKLSIFWQFVPFLRLEG